MSICGTGDTLHQEGLETCDLVLVVDRGTDRKSTTIRFRVRRQVSLLGLESRKPPGQSGPKTGSQSSTVVERKHHELNDGLTETG